MLSLNVGILLRRVQLQGTQLGICGFLLGLAAVLASSLVSESDSDSQFHAPMRQCTNALHLPPLKEGQEGTLSAAAASSSWLK